MNPFELFIKVFESLNHHNVDYILIGGFAVVLHGLPRTTQDIDLFIKPEENNISNLRTALKYVFDDASINEITKEELDKYAVIRYGTPEGFFIDVITGLGDKFRFEDIETDRINIQGEEIIIANVDSLISMKENTKREVDSSDVLFLKYIKSKNAGDEV